MLGTGDRRRFGFLGSWGVPHPSGGDGHPGHTFAKTVRLQYLRLHCKECKMHPVNPILDTSVIKRHTIICKHLNNV